MSGLELRHRDHGKIMPVLTSKHYLTMVTLVASLNAAATEAEDAIAACARIVSTGDRILCLETALRATSAPQESVAVTQESGPLPEPETTPEPVPAPAAVVSVSQSVQEAEKEAAPARSEAPVQLGLEDVAAAPEKPDSVDVVVTEVRESAYGKLIFVTADGQTWQQTDTKSIRYRELPFDANIRTAAAGSFFIRPLSGGVSVRVKRLR